MIFRRGDFTSMAASGRQFWPLDPRADEVELIDIARALSMQCRFGGHVNRFYSVAQHSVLVSWQCRDNPVAGLLHDAAEAYLVDVPTPIKKHLHGYAGIEEGLLRVIGKKYGVTLHPMCDEVRVADARALATEQRDLRPRYPFWTPPAAPYDDVITPWSPERAEKEFLVRATILGLQ